MREPRAAAGVRGQARGPEDGWPARCDFG